MLATLLLPDSNVLEVDKLIVEEDVLVVVMRTFQPEAGCPVCSQRSRSIHSHYKRTVTDLPWATIPVQLRLHVRKFFCHNDQCDRTIFTERLPTVVAPWGRRSERMTVQQRQLGLDFGGEAGARAGNRLGLPTSGDTVLRMVRGGAAPAHPTPRVLGVDDWAKRKGRTYGTILVDLERHQAVDLLPDRRADTLAQWLQEHPGVEVISRDRSSAYADGAKRGAPEAIQVADRFHLIGNLREALEAVIARQDASLSKPPASADGVSPEQTTQYNASNSVSADVPEETETDEGPEASIAFTRAMRRYEPKRIANRARRKARYDKVVALHQHGVSQKAIALRVNLSAKTIGRWLRSGTFPERVPHRNRRALADSSRPAPQPPAPERTRSPRQISSLLIRDREKLSTKDKDFLDQFLETNPSVATAYRLSQDFRDMARKRKAEAFDTWLEAVSASGLLDLQRFAAALKRDYDAVFAALSLHWSNGPVEGHVNRLKFIKRQGYGRANFDLLRQRVLAA
jgi:transposase